MLVLFTRSRHTTSQDSSSDTEKINAFIRALRANREGVVDNMHLGIEHVAMMFDPLHNDQTRSFFFEFTVS